VSVNGTRSRTLFEVLERMRCRELARGPRAGRSRERGCGPIALPEQYDGFGQSILSAAYNQHSLSNRYVKLIPRCRASS
jgi:hypothetical protein